MIEQKLLCITGKDGTGKTTLLKLLAEKLDSCHVANIWDIMDGGISTVPFRSKKDVDDYLCELTPDSRLLFLAHALKFSTDRALRSGKKVILLNAYIYKYFSSELALGAGKTIIKELALIFPEPELVFSLTLQPEIAAARKTSFSRYECGLAKDPSALDFISFQQKIPPYTELIHHSQWHTLDATETPEQLAEKIIQQLR